MVDKQIRASALSIFNACPYKFHNNTYSINPKITYFGTLIHYLIRDKNIKDIMLDYYNNNINPDMQLERIGHKLIDNACEYVNNIEGEKLEEFPMLYKLPFGYEDNRWLEGTADLVVITSSGKIKIYDYKTANTSSWYEGEDIWKETPQGKIYSFLAGKIFGADEIEFIYIVLEKKNQGKLTTYSKIYKTKEIEKEILELTDKYIQNDMIEDYEATPCRFCFFCPFKKDGTCPAYN